MSKQDRDVLIYAVASGALLMLCLTGTIQVAYSITQLARGARP